MTIQDTYVTPKGKWLLAGYVQKAEHVATEQCTEVSGLDVYCKRFETVITHLTDNNPYILFVDKIYPQMYVPIDSKISL